METLMSRVHKECERVNENSTDMIVASPLLSSVPMDTELGIELPNGHGTLPLTQHAHMQVSNVCEIPWSYYRKLMDTGSLELLSRNVNRFLPQHKDDAPKKKLIRITDGRIRAYLSSRYKCLDNLSLLNCFIEKIKDHEVNYVGAEIDDKYLCVKAIFPDKEGDVKPGDTIRQGIMLLNSEVGASSLVVKPMFWRLVCSNGAIAFDGYGDKNSTVRAVHIGRDRNLGFYSDKIMQKEAELTWLKVEESIDHAMNGLFLDEYIGKAKKALEIHFDDPVKIVDNVAMKYKWTNEEKNKVQNNFTNGEDSSLYGLSNAITAAAKDLSDIESRLRFERLGCNILDLRKVTKVEDIEIGSGTGK